MRALDKAAQIHQQIVNGHIRKFFETPEASNTCHEPTEPIQLFFTHAICELHLNVTMYDNAWIHVDTTSLRR